MADDLVYSANIDDSKALAALRRLDKEAEQVAKDADKSFKNIDKSVESTAKSMGKLSGVAAGLTLAFVQLGQRALSAIVDNIGESITLAEVQIQAEAQLAAAIKSTGNAAGLTLTQFKELASGLQAVTNYGDETILVAEGILATFTKIGAETFPRATKATLDLATRMKTDLNTAAKLLGKALNDTEGGLDGLQRAAIQFTDAQKDQIKSLTKAGDVAGAQSLILDELERQFGGSAEAARDASSGYQAAQNAIGDLKEAVGIELLPSVREYNEIVRQAAEGWTVAIQNVGLLTDALQETTGLTAKARDDIQGLDGVLLLATDPMEALSIGFERIQKSLEEIITPGANKLAQGIIESTVGLDEFAKGLEEAARKRDEVLDVPFVPPIDEAAAQEMSDELKKALEEQEKIERDALRKRIDIIRKANQKALDTELDFIQKRIDAATDYARKIDDIERKNAQAITDSGTDLRRDEEDALTDYNRKRADLERDSAKERIKIEEGYREELRKINQNFEDNADEAARQRDAVTFFRLQRDRDRQIQEARTTRNKKVDEAKVEGVQRQEELKRSLDQQLEDARLADSRRLEDLQIRLDREFEEARINRERDLEDIAIAEERKRQELKTSLDRQLEDARIANTRRVADFKDSLDEEVKAQLEAENKKLQIIKDANARRAELDRQQQSTIERFQEAGRTSRLGGRQAGGPVGAGQTVAVAEGGNYELFKPQVAGNVIPLGPGITSPLAATNIANTVNNYYQTQMSQSFGGNQDAMTRIIAENAAANFIRRVIGG